MASTTSVVDQAQDLLRQRLLDLDDERRRVERALAELGVEKTRRRGPGRPPGSKAVKGASTPRKRRRRRGTRADQAVKVVEKNPGISASNIAQQLKIKPNYLYRVLGELEKDGRLSRKGREYYPVG